VITDNANLRSGPGTNFAVVGQARTNDRLQVAAVSTDGDWYLLATNQWIAVFLVTELTASVPTVTDEILAAVQGTTEATGGEAASTATPAPPPVAPKPTVTVDANLRSGPGTTFETIGGTVTGQEITIVGRNADSGWLRLDNGGWVFTALVANLPDLNTVPVVNPDGTPAEPSAAAPAAGLGTLLPTPTPLPAAGNTELASYIDAALGLVSQFDVVQTSIDGLLAEANNNGALVGDSSWRTRANAALTLLRRTAASVGELAVPASAQTLHAQLESAALAYAAAADSLASAVQAGSLELLRTADTQFGEAISGLTGVVQTLIAAQIP
jgi:uncharacterized protein YraI